MPHRSHHIGSSPKKLAWQQFEEEYGFNEYRQSLINGLWEEIVTKKHMIHDATILVFGSFVTDEEKPNDLDVMISCTPADQKAQTYLLTHNHKFFSSRNKIDIHEFTKGETGERPYPTERLVRMFNNEEQHRGGVIPSNCVKLPFDEL